MQISFKNVFPILVFFMPASYLPPLEAQAQQGQRGAATQVSGQPNHVLHAPINRVVFDSAPFSAGSVVPRWDNGYLISSTPEVTSPGVSNVRLYDAHGQLTLQSAIWFPDAQTVLVLSTDVTQQGSIVASGTAVKADGTRAYFIAGTDSTGKVTQVIQTNPFFPANICATPDGTVWSFGNSGNKAATDEALLRHFDLRKGLVASYLPRSSFGGNRASPAIRGNERKEVYFRCSPGRVTIYSGVTDAYIEFDIVRGTARQFVLDRSSNDLPVHGFAVTEKGEAFGYLRDYSAQAELQGLFHLDLDTTQMRARWVPVKGASGRKGQERIVSGLYGADREALVHTFDDDPAERAGILWSSVEIE